MTDYQVSLAGHHGGRGCAGWDGKCPERVAYVATAVYNAGGDEGGQRHSVVGLCRACAMAVRDWPQLEDIREAV